MRFNFVRIVCFNKFGLVQGIGQCFFFIFRTKYLSPTSEPVLFASFCYVYWYKFWGIFLAVCTYFVNTCESCFFITCINTNFGAPNRCPCIVTVSAKSPICFIYIEDVWLRYNIKKGFIKTMFSSKISYDAVGLFFLWAFFLKKLWWVLNR